MHIRELTKQKNKCIEKVRGIRKSLFKKEFQKNVVILKALLVYDAKLIKIEKTEKVCKAQKITIIGCKMQKKRLRKLFQNSVKKTV